MLALVVRTIRRLLDPKPEDIGAISRRHLADVLHRDWCDRHPVERGELWREVR